MKEIWDVREYGAVGDGVSLDTAAIQKAMDECSEAGGGTVFFPKGVYLSGTLELRSNVTLEISATAVLQASSNKNDYPGAGDTENFLGNSYFLVAEGIEKLRITGQGTVDGSGPDFWTDEVINNVPNLGPIMKPKSFRPRALLYMVDCIDISFYDVTFRNSPCFTLWLLGCDRVNIDRVTIDNPQHGPNTDAIDVDCSSNVHISNCHISAGDDAIALKSDAKRLGRKKACENITVTNCTFISRACGVRIGYEGDAPIRDCCFSNIVMRDTDIGFSLVSILPNIPPRPECAKKSEYLEISEGCQIERICISNIVMDNVNSPFYMWLGAEVDGVHQGCINDISIFNVIANANNSCCISGMPEHEVQNIVFSNFTLKFKTGIDPRTDNPPYQTGVWNAWGIPYAFYLRNASDIQFRGVDVSWREDACEGWQGAIRADECTGIDSNGLTVRGQLL